MDQVPGPTTCPGRRSPPPWSRPPAVLTRPLGRATDGHGTEDLRIGGRLLPSGLRSIDQHVRLARFGIGDDRGRSGYGQQRCLPLVRRGGRRRQGLLRPMQTVGRLPEPLGGRSAAHGDKRGRKARRRDGRDRPHRGVGRVRLQAGTQGECGRRPAPADAVRRNPRCRRPARSGPRGPHGDQGGAADRRLALQWCHAGDDVVSGSRRTQAGPNPPAANGSRHRTTTAAGLDGRSAVDPNRPRRHPHWWWPARCRCGRRPPRRSARSAPRQAGPVRGRRRNTTWRRARPPSPPDQAERPAGHQRHGRVVGVEGRAARLGEGSAGRRRDPHRRMAILSPDPPIRRSPCPDATRWPLRPGCRPAGPSTARPAKRCRPGRSRRWRCFCHWRRGGSRRWSKGRGPRRPPRQPACSTPRRRSAEPGWCRATSGRGLVGGGGSSRPAQARGRWRPRPESAVTDGAVGAGRAVAATGASPRDDRCRIRPAPRPAQGP